MIIQGWSSAPGWLVGRYVLMPDHLHVFAVPDGTDAPSLARWVAFWKSGAARGWPFPADRPVWQRDFWDRQIRTGESYGQKWDYVRNNPVRAGLVSHPDAWPFQGEIHRFEWHDA